MPDTDFEACPVGTMALLEQIADDLDGVTADPDVKSLCRLAVSHRDMVHAILKAHRERMGVEASHDDPESADDGHLMVIELGHGRAGISAAAERKGDPANCVIISELEHKHEVGETLDPSLATFAGNVLKIRILNKAAAQSLIDVVEYVKNRIEDPAK